MKKLMMLFVFAAFASLTNVNAQSCCTKKSASCAKSETSSTTQVAGESMVRKVANTTEEKASCTKAKACCSKTSGKSCAGESRTTDATAPKKEAIKVSVAASAGANE